MFLISQPWLQLSVTAHGTWPIFGTTNGFHTMSLNYHKIRMRGSKLTRFALIPSEMHCNSDSSNLNPRLTRQNKGKSCKRQWTVNWGSLCVHVHKDPTIHHWCLNFSACERQLNALSNGVIRFSKVLRNVEVCDETRCPFPKSRPCNFGFWGVLCLPSYHFAVLSRIQFCFTAPNCTFDELFNGIIRFTDPCLDANIWHDESLWSFFFGWLYIHSSQFGLN